EAGRLALDAESFRVGDLLAANLRDIEIKRNTALADVESPDRMKDESGRLLERPKRYQQVVISWQFCAPVFDLVEFADQQRHDLDRGEGRVLLVAPCDVEIRRDIEEQKRERAGAMSAPRRGSFEREIEPDGKEADAKNF